MLTVVLAVALVRFYRFLGDYQTVFEETRPALYQQNEVMTVFETRDAEQILKLADPVELGPFESRENFVDFLNDYLAGKEIGFGTKEGEPVNISYDERGHCYQAAFGGDADMQSMVEDYVLQMAEDYAMYISNDAAYNASDKYFPKGPSYWQALREIRGNVRCQGSLLSSGTGIRVKWN